MKYLVPLLLLLPACTTLETVKADPCKYGDKVRTAAVVIANTIEAYCPIEAQ